MFVHAIGEWLSWIGFWPLYFGGCALFFGVMGGKLYQTSDTAKRARYVAASRKPRFCRECCWAVPDTRYSEPEGDLAWSSARCMHVSAREYPNKFLVIGHDRPEDMRLCAIARSAERNLCGPRGRYWEKGQQLISPGPPPTSLPSK